MNIQEILSKPITLVGICIILFITPFWLAKGVQRTVLGRKLNVKESFECLIPIYNLMIADKGIFGTLRYNSYTLLFAILMTVIRIVQWRFFYSFAGGPIVHVVFLISWLLHILSHMVTVFIVYKDADTLTLPKMIILSIFYPFGEWYISSHLADDINEAYKSAKRKEDGGWD